VRSFLLKVSSFLQFLFGWLREAISRFIDKIINNERIRGIVFKYEAVYGLRMVRCVLDICSHATYILSRGCRYCGFHMRRRSLHHVLYMVSNLVAVKVGG
jgi:hypothetical protein